MIKIIRHYYVAESVYNWVRGLADWSNIAPGTYDLFVSLLTRSAWRYKIGAYNDIASPAYPLHSMWLRKIKANPMEIPKLLETDNIWHKAIHSRPGKCRYYWVNSNIIREFEALIFGQQDRHCVNLYTGKQARKNRPLPTDIQKPSLYDKNRNLVTSQLVADAVKTLTKQQVKINYDAFLPYALRLNTWFQRLCKINISNPTLKGRLVKHTRSVNFLCAHLQKFRSPSDGSVTYYWPVYRTLYTGRVTELSIGLQSCSIMARRKLLQDMHYTNFDLQNAQLNCLHYLLPPSQIKDELAKKISRIYTDAASFGLPKKLVKGFLYAYIFNAGKLNYRISAAIKLKKYAAEHQLLANFSDFVAGLEPIQTATKTLLSAIKSKLSMGTWINHAGITLSLEALQNLAEAKLNKYLRKNKTTMLCFPRQDYLDHAKDKILLAFYIQGIETYIIHTLTLAGSSDTYTVISNQHDGIIITGDKNAVNVQMQKINKAINANFVLAEKPL